MGDIKNLSVRPSLVAVGAPLRQYACDLCETVVESAAGYAPSCHNHGDRPRPMREVVDTPDEAASRREHYDTAEPQGMDCYTERAHLLALIARTWLAHLYIDPDAESGFKTVCAVWIADRWVGWHIADSDTALFQGIPVVPAEGMYDGHTTEQKYEHIRNVINSVLPYLR